MPRKKKGSTVRLRNARWHEGYKAFEKKKDHTANPYKSTTAEGCDWANGWETAMKDAKAG